MPLPSPTSPSPSSPPERLLGASLSTSIPSPSKQKIPAASIAASDILSDAATETRNVTEVGDNNDEEDEDYDRRSVESSASSTSVVFDQIESASNSLRTSHFFRPGGSPIIGTPTLSSMLPLPVPTDSPAGVQSSASSITGTSRNKGYSNPILAATSKLRSNGSNAKLSSESERLLLSSVSRNGSYHDDDESNIDIESEAAGSMEPLTATATVVATAAASSLNTTPNGELEDEEEESPEQNKRRRTTKRVFIGVLIGLTILWVIGLIFYLVSSMRRGGEALPPSEGDGSEKMPIQLNDLMRGEFSASKSSIDWLDDGIEGHDGLYAERDDSGKVVVGDYSGVTTTKTRILVDVSDFEYTGEKHVIARAWPGKGLEKVLLMTDPKKNWRHSYYGAYWIYDVSSKTIEPLIPHIVTADVRLAAWSPAGGVVAFVLENNLYIRNVSQQTVSQITTDGDKNTFYGIPDWVYEEEVFSGNSALWWSANGQYLAFLRSNDSSVPEYSIPYFEQSPIENGSYPEMVDVKYPKAGYDNPVVELMFLDLASYEVFLPRIDDPRNLRDNDRLITEVVWAGEKVIVRQTNRESDLLKIVLVDPLNRNGSVVREEDVSGKDGGWFEVTHDTTYIPANESQGRPEDGYIDTVIIDGYNHLAYFSPLNASSPKQTLTSGSWEVVDGPSAVDLTTGTVYFLATRKDPTERHLYAVQLDGTNFRNISNTDEDGYYGVSFSTGAGYLLLSYNGPKVPYQTLLSLRTGTNVTIQDNAKLTAKLDKYKVPETLWEQIVIEDDVVVNTLEIRPQDFSPGRKYPVVFHIYGGPGSQTVDKRFTISFETHIASALDAIVVSVDGRGTGFMGRQFRAVVRDRLGYWEARDQILAAKQWSKRSYVDPSRIAIWGWSYGGYMTLKTLEQDGGKTFSYGMAVAPVTDWRFYDSIYTERYMHTPQQNADGYDGSAIKNVTALKEAKRFLLMHGTGDDNVHFQNTLALIDKLDLQQVENYDMYVFPDSDHSIYFHNANKIVYDRLDRWIELAFAGAYDGRID
ncbi:dipeptidyl peptidase IV N-terminal region-domain-containing protein [Lipomyces tetrasporus]